MPRLRRGLRDARRPPRARAARRQRGVLRRRRVRTRAMSSQCEILHTTTTPPPARTASVGRPLTALRDALPSSPPALLALHLPLPGACSAPAPRRTNADQPRPTPHHTSTSTRFASLRIHGSSFPPAPCFSFPLPFSFIDFGSLKLIQAHFILIRPCPACASVPPPPRPAMSTLTSTKDRRQVPHSPCIMRPSPNALMACTVILLLPPPPPLPMRPGPRLRGDNFVVHAY